MSGGKRRLQLTGAASALLAAAASLGAPAGAEDLGRFALPSALATASWSGEVTAGAFGVVEPVPEACSPEVCDTVTLDLELPAGTWAQPGGMLVAIQWPEIDAFYDLDLFVYAPDGSLAGSSEVLGFSRNESVWVANPGNGRYTAVMLPKDVVSQPASDAALTPLRYDGFVRFQRGLTITRDELNLEQPFPRTVVAFGAAADTPPTELTPDIIPTTPRNFHIESTFGTQYYFYGDRGLRHQPSCYPWETVGLTPDEPSPTVGALRCLRWDQGEYNFGDGPLELHVYDGIEGVYQRLWSSDGSIRQVRLDGRVAFSQSHGLPLHRLEGDQALPLERRRDARRARAGRARQGHLHGGHRERAVRPHRRTGCAARVPGARFVRPGEPP